MPGKNPSRRPRPNPSADAAAKNRLIAGMIREQTERSILASNKSSAVGKVRSKEIVEGMKIVRRLNENTKAYRDLTPSQMGDLVVFVSHYPLYALRRIKSSRFIDVVQQFNSTQVEQFTRQIAKHPNKFLQALCPKRLTLFQRKKNIHDFVSAMTRKPVTRTVFLQTLGELARPFTRVLRKAGAEETTLSLFRRH